MQCWLAAYTFHIYAARCQVYIIGIVRLYKLTPIPFGDIWPPAFLIVVTYLDIRFRAASSDVLMLYQ